MTPTFIKSNAAAQLTMAVEVMNEQGELQTQQIACERPLTVYLNWKEIVTLMTLGPAPRRWCWAISRTRALSRIFRPSNR